MTNLNTVLSKLKKLQGMASAMMPAIAKQLEDLATDLITLDKDIDKLHKNLQDAARVSFEETVHFIEEKVTDFLANMNFSKIDQLKQDAQMVQDKLQQFKHSVALNLQRQAAVIAEQSTQKVKEEKKTKKASEAKPAPLPRTQVQTQPNVASTTSGIFGSDSIQQFFMQIFVMIVKFIQGLFGLDLMAYQDKTDTSAPVVAPNNEPSEDLPKGSKNDGVKPTVSPNPVASYDNPLFKNTIAQNKGRRYPLVKAVSTLPYPYKESSKRPKF